MAQNITVHVDALVAAAEREIETLSAADAVKLHGRPDVVLVDISGWKEPLEGLVSSIRSAAGDPMIIALNTTADPDAIGHAVHSKRPSSPSGMKRVREA